MRSFFLKNIHVFVLAILLLSQCPVLHAEEDKTDEGVKTNGVIIDMAQDRKVVKVGGIYQPEALDRYMDRRFTVLEEKMMRLESQLTAISQKLETISDELKDQASSKTPFQEKK